MFLLRANNEKAWCKNVRRNGNEVWNAHIWNFWWSVLELRNQTERYFVKYKNSSFYEAVIKRCTSDECGEYIVARCCLTEYFQCFVGGLSPDHKWSIEFEFFKTVKNISEGFVSSLALENIFLLKSRLIENVSRAGKQNFFWFTDCPWNLFVWTRHLWRLRWFSEYFVIVVLSSTFQSSCKILQPAI